MSQLTTITLLLLAIKQIESSKNTMAEIKSETKKYHYRKNKSPFNNPKLKMGHPIIQPRGQNH